MDTSDNVMAKDSCTPPAPDTTLAAGWVKWMNTPPLPLGETVPLRYLGCPSVVGSSIFRRRTKAPDCVTGEPDASEKLPRELDAVNDPIPFEVVATNAWPSKESCGTPVTSPVALPATVISSAHATIALVSSAATKTRRKNVAPGGMASSIRGR